MSALGAITELEVAIGDLLGKVLRLLPHPHASTAPVIQSCSVLRLSLTHVGQLANGDDSTSSALRRVEAGCADVDTAIASLELDVIENRARDSLSGIVNESQKLHAELKRKDQLVSNQRRLLGEWRAKLGTLREATPRVANPS
eukprot:m.42583 g.42583  ORF g.42583 m.42583 type:complete len:143 (+) comp8339_c0_seq2:154-582(+)